MGRDDRDDIPMDLRLLMQCYDGVAWREQVVWSGGACHETIAKPEYPCLPLPR
jgi:hypothetical protein